VVGHLVISWRPERVTDGAADSSKAQGASFASNDRFLRYCATRGDRESQGEWGNPLTSTARPANVPMWLMKP